MLLILLVASAPVFAQRERNDTINLPLQPSTSGGQLVLQDAFPGVQFNKPVAVRPVPGRTDQLLVAERVGRILLIDNLENPTVRVFLDIRDRVHASDFVNDRRAEGLTSFALHPNFAANRRFFVTYTTVTTTSQGAGHHNRVSEFRARDGEMTSDPSTEKALITQFDEGDGHNINDAHFGPDGYLYISSGDEGDGGRGDDFHNAQKIDKDFFSAILRIDIDKRAGNLPPNPHPASTDNYSVPADNPFVGIDTWQGQAIDQNKVRDEFWAIGLRNPWRFSFDPLTGNIFEGDVGQHGREEVNRIVKGGNYGWSYREGELVGPAGQPPQGLSLIGPLFQYSTGFGSFEGFSITGGVVYRGDRIPELYGHLIFADYVSPNVWAMNVDQGGQPRRLFGESGIAGFGYDPRNGDVLLVNHDRGIIERIDISGGGGVNIPYKLSETGIFSDLANLTPQRGVYPYDVNVAFWSDGAVKRRWFSIPDPAKKMTFNAGGNWSFPSGAVFIKHFELETEKGNPQSRKRVETRVLMKNDAGAYGITYKWNDAGTEAELVGENGDSKTFNISESGQVREQTWRFPSRQECMSCHTGVGGIVLGFNTAQMNRNGGFASSDANQLSALGSAGFFENPPTDFGHLPALARLDDTTVSETFRAKSYFAANCSFCHQPEGSARAKWDGRIQTPLSKANIINGTLFNVTGDGSERVVVPGDAGRSAILTRMQATDRDRMPPIGSTVHDAEGIALLTHWVNEGLKDFETYDQWAARSLDGQDTGPDADPDGDGVKNMAEYLLSSDPLSAASKLNVTTRADGSSVVYSYMQPADRSILVESSSLPGGPWIFLQPPTSRLDFPATPVNKELIVPARGGEQFYRFHVVEP